MKIIEMLDQGEVQKARDEAMRVLAKNPTDPEARVVVLKLTVLDKKFEQAEALAARIERDSLPDALLPHYLSCRGMLAALRADYDAALVFFQRATQLSPPRAEAFFGLGMALAEQSKYEQSLPMLERAVELSPHNGVYHYNLAQNLIWVDQPTRALDHIERAIAHNPLFVPSYLLLSKILQGLGKYADARTVLEKGLSVMPGDARLLSAYTTTCLTGGDVGGAYASAVVMAGKFPADSFAQANLAILLVAQRRFDEALEVCRKAADAAGPTAQLKCIEATIHEARRDVAAATAAYEDAMALDPSDWTAPNNLGQLVLRMNPGDDARAAVARAITLFEEAARRAPQRVEPMLNLALAYARADQTERGREMAAAILELGLPPKHPVREQAERLVRALAN